MKEEDNSFSKLMLRILKHHVNAGEIDHANDVIRMLNISIEEYNEEIKKESSLNE